MAKCEANDTLATLEKEGYEGIAAKNPNWKAGEDVDVTSYIPNVLAEAIRKQQNTRWEDVKDWNGDLNGAEDVPANSTIGSSGLDLTDPGWAGHPLGLGNCYGFVGLWGGVPLPPGVAASDFSMYFKKGEVGAGPDQPGRDTGITIDDIANRKRAQLVPDQGLEDFLTKGRMKTAAPVLGDVSLFRRGAAMAITHAAVVLGKSQDKTVCMIQKLNESRPYAIATDKSKALSAFGNPEYYTKK